MKSLLKLTNLLAFSTAICALNATELPEVASGKIERLENFQSEYVTARNVDVWLPNGYDHSQKYAVLYMHDGQMLFDATKTWNGQEWAVDEVVGDLISQNQIRPCIVVGVWNAGEERWPDYYPQKPFEKLSQEFLKEMGERGNQAGPVTVSSDAYLKFLVTELKPYIDSNYSTHTDASSTFVAGSSMGGLISMYAICEYPGTFGGAACISTHWVGAQVIDNNPMPDTFVAYLKTKLPAPENHKIYFDYGTETLDAHYEPYQIQIDEVMQTGGYNTDNWQTLKCDGANHSENAWQARLDTPIKFLLGN